MHQLVRQSVEVIKAYCQALKEAGAIILMICEHAVQMMSPKHVKESSMMASFVTCSWSFVCSHHTHVMNLDNLRCPVNIVRLFQLTLKYLPAPAVKAQYHTGQKWLQLFLNRAGLPAMRQ